MKLKSLNCALLAIFSAGGLCSTASALAAGIDTVDSSLSGTLTVAGTTESSAGPSFDLSVPQTFRDCLCDPYSSFATGNLAEGSFGLQAVSDSQGLGTASATYSVTVVNDGTAPAAASFNFYIPGAMLISAPLGSTGGSDGGTIGAVIDVNGHSAWSYSATLTGTAPGPGPGEPFAENFSLSTTGSGLTPTSSLFQDNSVGIVTFSSYSGTISLGTLAVGQSEVVSYTLSGETFSSFAPDELQYYGGALAQIGDPLSVSGEPLPPPSFGIEPTGVVAAVPETSTEVMFAAGLALLGGLAARRKQRASTWQAT